MTAFHRFNVAGYFALTLVITWAAWIPRSLAANGTGEDFWITLGDMWTYGPAAAAVLASLLWGGNAGIRELGTRLIRWRVHPGFYALVLVGPAGVWLLTAGAYTALGGDASDVTPAAVRAGAWAVVPLLVVLCLTDGLGEETGWRGYALPRLLERTGPVSASLILGVVWALWHLPLYWTPGVPLYHSPILLLFIDLPLTALLYTWVFRHTGGSALLAILLHGASNVFAVPLPSDGASALPAFLLAMLIRACLAVAVVVAFRRAAARPVPTSATTGVT